jgi:hypothetical protein
MLANRLIEKKINSQTGPHGPDFVPGVGERRLLTRLKRIQLFKKYSGRESKC